MKRNPKTRRDDFMSETALKLTTLTYPTTLNAPTFSFEQLRWATARHETVDDMHYYWTENPNAVRVFSDPRLGNSQVVMLRKDRFEALEKIKNDLTRGQIVVQQQIKTLSSAIAVAKTLAQRLKKSTPSPAHDDAEAIENQIEVIVGISQVITSELSVKSTGFKLEPTPLSEEELADLDDEEGATRGN
jgi:hypothetical protein